jgi:DNA-binding PadR family transcriptional regulator
VSTLGFALLSLLTRGPATGYELAQRMRAPIGYFWAAKHSQIYPELGRLADAGYVRVREQTGRGPRPNKTYTLSAAGRRALAEWLPAAPTFQPRSEVTLKAYAVNSADHAQMSAMFQAVADDAAAQVTAWQRELDAMIEAGVDDLAHPQFGNFAALRMGIASHRVLHEWAGWLAGRLRDPA